MALLDRTLAERLFPGVDALGRRVTVRGVEREIVGVVGNVVQFDLGETPQGTLYTPYAQER